jgi:hypothetical protein
MYTILGVPSCVLKSSEGVLKSSTPLWLLGLTKELLNTK